MENKIYRLVAWTDEGEVYIAPFLKEELEKDEPEEPPQEPIRLKSKRPNRSN